MPGAKRFAENFGFPAANSVEAHLRRPFDRAVMLLTPPNTHLELVERAAAAGKHILLEKPLEISIERPKLLVPPAEKAGVKLGVVLQHRFRPAREALAKLIAEAASARSSALGAHLNWRPQSYYDQPGRGTKARDGGGVLLTQAIHTLDLLISLAGLPEEVSAYAPRPARSTAWKPRTSPSRCRFGNGAIGTISRRLPPIRASRSHRNHRHEGHGGAARDGAVGSVP